VIVAVGVMVGVGEGVHVAGSTCPPPTAVSVAIGSGVMVISAPPGAVSG